MKKVLTLIIAILTACQIFADNREAPMMFGLNESGGEFAGIYPGIDGTHYGYPNKDDLQYAHDKGFGIIRLPFRWERIQRPLGAALKATEINKIKQVLDWAEELNLRVIFDMHNFGRYCTYCNGSNSDANVYAIIGDETCTVEQFADVWRLLAAEFKDYTCIWAYEIMNEPYAMRNDTPWFNIAQAAINAIREVDTATPIMIDGNEYASARRWKDISNNFYTLTDPSDNLIFSAHCYFDYNTSGEYTKTYDNDGATPQTGVERMRPFVEWCQEHNVRGFMGEYGIPDDDVRWDTVLDNALAYLQANGIGGTYWSAGHRWGDYKLSVHPANNYTIDRPQMAILEKYTTPLKPSLSEIMVWSGPSASNVWFVNGGNATQQSNYNALMERGQLAVGDIIRIYYTGATAGDKIYIQNKDWNTWPNAAIGVSTDVISAGNGQYDITVTEDFLASLPTSGLLVRHTSTGTYTFECITVVKNEEEDAPTLPGYEVLVDENTYIQWDGSICIIPAAKIANIAVGDRLHVYVDKFYTSQSTKDNKIEADSNKDSRIAFQRYSGAYHDAITPAGTYMINNKDYTVEVTQDMYDRLSKGDGTFYDLIVTGYWYSFSKVVLEHPSRFVSVTMSADGLATFSHPTEHVDVTLVDGLNAYTASLSGNVITTEILNQTIPAQEGVILQGQASTTYRIPFASTASALHNNILVATDGNSVSGYVLGTTAERGVGFYKVTNKDVEAGKAYIPASVSADAMIRIDLMGEATGIDELTNSRVNKLTNSAYYNVMGQRLSPTLTGRGIVIVNGKKYMK